MIQIYFLSFTSNQRLLRFHKIWTNNYEYEWFRLNSKSILNFQLHTVHTMMYIHKFPARFLIIWQPLSYEWPLPVFFPFTSSQSQKKLEYYHVFLYFFNYSVINRQVGKLQPPESKSQSLSFFLYHLLLLLDLGLSCRHVSAVHVLCFLPIVLLYGKF